MHRLKKQDTTLESAFNLLQKGNSISHSHHTVKLSLHYYAVENSINSKMWH